MGYNRRSITSGLSGAIVLLGLILAFVSGGFNLVIFFIALALAALVSSVGTPNPHAIYGGIISAMWLIMLALFFATHSWLWFLVGALISALLGTLFKPIIASLVSTGLFGRTPKQEPPQAYQSYQPAPQTYQEGGQQHPYPPPSAPPAQQDQ
jgi:hypothetical protein